MRRVLRQEYSTARTGLAPEELVTVPGDPLEETFHDAIRELRGGGATNEMSVLPRPDLLRREIGKLRPTVEPRHESLECAPRVVDVLQIGQRDIPRCGVDHCAAVILLLLKVTGFQNDLNRTFRDKPPDVFPGGSRANFDLVDGADAPSVSMRALLRARWQT
jgi:hypothetical protein